MRIDIFTIFPAIFESPLRESLLGRAAAAGILDIRIHDIRDQTDDPHHQVDDEPFGGGPGMVMKAEPLFGAVEALGPDRGGRSCSLPPVAGSTSRSCASSPRRPSLVLVCGRYEGIDERFVEGLPAEEISIGDYVLSGGELPALVLLEAVTRLVPGVIGNEASHEQDSFGEDGILDHPHYTRPREFRGMAVPDVLLSGNHAEIERWRRTRRGRRPAATAPTSCRE